MIKYLFGTLIFCLCACGKQTSFLYIGDDESSKIVTISSLPSNYISPCRQFQNYLPDTIHPEFNALKKLRINWHCVDDSSQNNNFKRGEGDLFFYNLTNNANYRLEKNAKMKLPHGNNTPVYFPYLQWVISPSKGHEEHNGYYYHVQAKPKFFMNRGPLRSDYDTKIIQECGIGKDSILNIFVVPFPPDSMTKMKIKMFESGIALGNHVKLGGLFQSKRPDWFFATLLSHEIGHVLGLSHAWYDDGCDDTPNNPNCWNYTETPPCDKFVSNNLMDYNSEQMAISPCQIGKMHQRLEDTSSSVRKFLIKDWCIPDTSTAFFIRDSISWLGSRDINKSIVVEKGGILKICCRLGMAEGQSIKVKIGGKLIVEEAVIHNDCNRLWKGIFVEKHGKNTGKIEFIGSVRILDVDKQFTHLEKVKR